MKLPMKRLLSLVIIGAVLLTCGCGQTPVVEEAEPATTISNLSKPEEDIASETIVEASQEEKEAFATSTPENDTDVGLKNIKIDKAEESLTHEQQMIIEYFDEDYLTVPNYEFIRRYPNVYSNAQLQVNGIVKKVLTFTNEAYKLVLWMGKSEDAFFYRSDYTPSDYEAYLEENAGNLIVINGIPSDAWFIEGDYLEVYGRYSGIETIEIDGTSYTVPFINVKKAFISSDIANGVAKYDTKYIKTIAETIFGDDIEVRNPVADTDYDSQYEWRVLDEKPFYIIEPENQSNAKFTKYRFYTKSGLIEDAKTGSDFWLLGTDDNIQRNIEFSADFEHFFLFAYDYSLENLTLEYYDYSLNKIWKREFEETTNAVYDYTKNNIYLIANNELYIINIETGEDTFSPAFIGAKQDIRKLHDGILTIGESKSDAVIKNDLSGNMVWKTNLSDNVYSVDGVQLVDTNIILQLTLDDGLHYIVLDSTTGSVIIDAISLN